MTVRRFTIALTIILLTGVGCGSLRQFPLSTTQLSPAAQPGGRTLRYDPISKVALGYEPQVAAVSPDGRLVATAGRDPFIDIWDVATGGKRTRLIGHRLPPIGALVFARDGRTLLSGGGDQERGTSEPTIRMWDLATGELLESISEAHTAEIVSLAISADAKQLFSAGTDSLKMWDIPPVKGARGMWADHISPICGMAASRDLQIIATGGRDHRVLVRRGLDLARFETLHGHEAAPCGLSLSPDGSQLVSWDFGSTLSTLRVWDLARLAPVRRVDVRGRILTVFFRGSGATAAMMGVPVVVGGPRRQAGIPDTVQFLSVQDGRIVGELSVTPKLVVSTPDGRIVVSAGWDGTVRVFRLRPQE